MLPIRYWNRIQNIGDAINPYILELVSGRKPYYATNAEEEHVLGVGSIFFMANRMSHIWGSGILDPRGDLFHIDLAKVHAVRGKRTLAALDSFGLTKPVPLGDPGVFVDEIPEIAETIGKGEIRRGTVIVPHYALVASEQIEQLARALDATILSPRTLSLDFVREIAGAEAVVSQSLHGLIFAEALGKPSAWIAPSDDQYLDLQVSRLVQQHGRSAAAAASDGRLRAKGSRKHSAFWPRRRQEGVAPVFSCAGRRRTPRGHRVPRMPGARAACGLRFIKRRLRRRAARCRGNLVRGWRRSRDFATRSISSAGGSTSRVACS